MAAGFVAILLTVAVALAMAYPNLPDVSELADYRPKLPLRVYSTEGALLGEFGEERRTLTPIAEIPKVMDAVLAIEDTASSSTVAWTTRACCVRAGQPGPGQEPGRLHHHHAGGAQCLPLSEKTYTRKIYEILLTFKLEHLLSKEQILEIYMNQIYLGNRAYGFAAASEAYFGKPKDITVAEAAMLAGLPKAPSAYNPISNPKRAHIRQQYIIERMEENGFITAQQAEQARAEPLQLKSSAANTRVHAEYVAEMARQLIFAQYGNDAYTRGLNVYTTLNAGEQEAAYNALRQGIMDYERRQRTAAPRSSSPCPPTDRSGRRHRRRAGQPPRQRRPAGRRGAGSLARKIVARAGRREDRDHGRRPQARAIRPEDKAPPNIKIRPAP
jgi:penicillin-binding protein 1A